MASLNGSSTKYEAPQYTNGNVLTKGKRNRTSFITMVSNLCHSILLSIMNVRNRNISVCVQTMLIAHSEIENKGQNANEFFSNLFQIMSNNETSNSSRNDVWNATSKMPTANLTKEQDVIM